MIIGIDASHANKAQRTGVEEYCFRIIQEFKKNIPSHVKVVLYSPVELLPELAVVPNNWEVKILHWPLKKLWSQFRLAFELWKNPPDVYFSTGQLLPFFSPKNSVVTVHDSAFEAHPSAYRFFGRQYLKWMNRLIIKKAKIILTSTEFNKQEMLKFYSYHSTCHSDRVQRAEEFLINKIKIIPLAFDNQKYNLQAPTMENTYGEYILSIGRLEEKKNTKRIVEAFNILKKQLPNLKLILVGNSGAGFEEVQAAIEQSDYKKDIICPGFMSSQQLVSILKQAKVFVFPSLYEGFGIPVLEALAVGTPVVVSDIPALKEIGGQAVEYADPLSPQQIAFKIYTLMSDVSLREQKITLGVELTKQYTWSKTAEKTWNILSDVLL
ncbi:MAG: AprM [uncultured bacterium]|nr:MAG: AprM [uncultured bacterium]